MIVQHAKWLAGQPAAGVARPRASLNVLLTSTAGATTTTASATRAPGFMDTMLSKKGTDRPRLLAAGRQLPARGRDHCLRSRDYVNLIIIDKQPQLQWLALDEAIEHCERGASVWAWAGNRRRRPGRRPGLRRRRADARDARRRVRGCAQHAPELRVRVVNVVDLMGLYPPDVHPHGLQDDAFRALFTADAT
jgi:xylulose-5-phosphate/fructose-6-phosphate phosphoketolase